MSVRSRSYTFGVVAALALGVGGPSAALAGSKDEGGQICTKSTTTISAGGMKIETQPASKGDVEKFGNGTPDFRVLPDGGTVTVFVACFDVDGLSPKQKYDLNQRKTCNPSPNNNGNVMNCHY